MPFTVSDAADATNRQVSRMYARFHKEVDTRFKEIYGVETGVTDLTTTDSSLSSIGYAGRVVENQPFPEQKPVQGYDQTYTQSQYAVIFTVSKLMWFFGIKKRKLEQLTRETIKAVAHLRSRRLYERLEQSFNTSYVAEDISGNYTINLTGGDGVALISNAHPRPDGGPNNNNRLTDGTNVNLPFGVAAMEAALRTGSLIRDPKGMPMVGRKFNTLVVAENTTNHFRALQIMKTLKEGKAPGTSDNMGASVQAGNIHATPWFLNNPDFFFFMDTTEKDMGEGLQYKESQDIVLSPVNIVYKTKELQWTSEAMWAAGHNGFGNIIGSKATNAA